MNSQHGQGRKIPEHIVDLISKLIVADVPMIPSKERRGKSRRPSVSFSMQVECIKGKKVYIKLESTNKDISKLI